MVRWPSLHFFFFNRGRTRGLKMITDHVKVLSVSDKGSTLGSKSCISYTICCHPCLMSHLVSGTLFLTHHHALGDAWSQLPDVSPVHVECPPRTRLVGSKAPDFLPVKFIGTWSYASYRVLAPLIPSSLCLALPEPSLLTHTSASLTPSLPQAVPLSRMPFLLLSTSSSVGSKFNSASFRLLILKDVFFLKHLIRVRKSHGHRM